MDLQSALVVRLEGAPAVEALVVDRIHWGKRDQGGDLPALVLRRVGGSPDYHLEGEGDVYETRLQADCLARTSAEAARLARAVGELLIEGALVDGGEGEDFEFLDGDRQAPIDMGEDTPQGFVHRAMLEVVLRHGRES